jgi:transcriptional regulator with XRE-family HTH domain
MKERLKELRKELGLSQRVFCQALGLNQTTYASFETGERQIKEAYIKLICKVYNVNEEWLTTGTGKMFLPKFASSTIELLEIYDSLIPPLQDYLLQQIRELKKLQDRL